MMRIKIIYILFVLMMFGTPISSYSVPAYPRIIKVTQKDGTVISIRKYGDEFFNYTTTVDGYMISQKDGIYYYSDIAFSGDKAISQVKAHDPSKRGVDERRMLTSKSTTRSNPLLSSISYSARSARVENRENKFPSKGNIRSIIILVNFRDKKFLTANNKESFVSMLNTPNYSDNFGTGSARDYFLDNSKDKFNPQFDVYGPVDLPSDMAYYGANSNNRIDINAPQMVIDACTAADGDINFSQYDYDNNGEIDNVFIYYAGYNEAEGADEDTVWPHKFSVESKPSFDGKVLFNYACSSELRGYGSNDVGMAGIGTFVHEFGHVLGLADTYDTGSLEENKSTGLLDFDIMTSGSYNNKGRTPPYYMAYQRYELGWIEPKEIKEASDFTLNSIVHNDAYIINTTSEGEYFMLEYRNETESAVTIDGRNWDKYISAASFGAQYIVNGLLITHVDKSENLVDGIKAIDRWSLNQVNNVFSHECVRIVYANGDRVSSYDDDNKKGILFPGSENVTSFTYSTKPAAIDWKGNKLFTGISNIAVTENSTVVFSSKLAAYTISPGSNFVILNLVNADSNNKWNIRWKKSSGGDFKEILDYDKEKLVISELDVNTEYRVTLELSVNDGEYIEEDDMIFKTLVEIKDYPTIIFDYEHNSASATFTPALSNFRGDMSTVKWFLNGIETKINYTKTLPSGDYIIICEIDRNGVIDKIYKELKVN